MYLAFLWLHTHLKLFLWFNFYKDGIYLLLTKFEGGTVRYRLCFLHFN